MAIMAMREFGLIFGGGTHFIGISVEILEQ